MTPPSTVQNVKTSVWLAPVEGTGATPSDQTVPVGQVRVAPPPAGCFTNSVNAVETPVEGTLVTVSVVFPDSVKLKMLLFNRSMLVTPVTPVLTSTCSL